MPYPSVAVVILNYNGQQHLSNFLPSVVASSYPGLQIIVADNASTDQSKSIVERFPTVSWISLETNFGFAQGYNEALKKIDADYWILLNSDVEVTTGWIEPMVKLMTDQPQIAACQPKLLTYHRREYFEYAGAAGGWLDWLGYPFARGRVFDVCEQDEGQFEDNIAVCWASGAALMVRPEVFREVGGFDGQFFAHMEEIDLCWRIQLAGHQIYVCPTSVVFHVGGGTLSKGNDRKVYLNFRNNLIMLSKNLPIWKAFWVVTFRFALDAISAWKSLFEGERTYFNAVVKAHIDYVKWLFSSKEKNVFPAKRGIPKSGYWRGSVVWQHFALGKKHFQEIVGKV